MNILRLFFAVTFLLVNCDLTGVAQTSQQRQQQQQRYQQQQRQQQLYQRQQQLQARQQRLQQLQARQRQLQQQQQQLRYKQQQLQQQRQTAAQRATAAANANKRMAAARANAVRRKIIPNNSQQAQTNKIGRSRALAVAKPSGPVSGSGPKAPIPAIKSLQVLQAKASLRTNQLSDLRASLQTKLQARATTSSSVNGIRGKEQRPKAGGGGGGGDCDKKPEDCDPPRGASAEGPKRPPDTKIRKKVEEEDKKKADEKLTTAAANHGGSSTPVNTPGGGGRKEGPPSERGPGGNGAGGGGSGSDGGPAANDNVNSATQTVVRGLNPTGLRPPITGSEQWKTGSASRVSERAKGGQSLWDPKGGEWRWAPEDKYHNPHWDYNPHDNPNSPWQNVSHGNAEPRKPEK